ncbi:Radical SAM domain protein [Desulfatibacillum aliphaticivorans]|uniref:Radical SAM domain protein n=1 Tax=Desulfatibacillum aliphaticivorans TaxID=218208 RepID=B8FD56_DESAL|nr:radical SAM protein [Desulfatibacillum aliphaticivorans]ACL06487.1 Radical SAM domain protein [Desulfatibacillum aliphaticivorans]
MEKEKRPFVIPIFLPHAGCPHQCVFCNQRAITGAARPFSAEDARAEVERYLSFPRKSKGPTIISFYGGNFLGISRKRIRDLLDLASQYVNQGRVDGIRFSTRPDTVSPLSLSLLEGYPVKTVELGVQSMDEEVLEASRRGHTVLEIRTAHELLREKGYETGLQMMIGLPGDDGAQSLASAREIAALSPDFVRIYPTVVLENSPLAEMWRSGRYEALTLDRAVDLCSKAYAIFHEANIPVVRMGLAVSDSLDEEGAVLAGPYHPAFGHLALSAWFLEKALALLKDAGLSGGPVVFRVHPQSVSVLRGLKNSNMDALEGRLGERPGVMEDRGLRRDQLALERPSKLSGFTGSDRS